VWTDRVLRFVAEYARDEALPFNRTSDHHVGRARRDMGLVFRRRKGAVVVTSEEQSAGVVSTLELRLDVEHMIDSQVRRAYNSCTRRLPSREVRPGAVNA
jgi:hypothetical protein